MLLAEIYSFSRWSLYLYYAALTFSELLVVIVRTVLEVSSVNYTIAGAATSLFPEETD